MSRRAAAASVLVLASFIAACSTASSHRAAGAGNGTSTSTAPATSSSSTTPATASSSWTTYGGSFTRTSIDATDPARTTTPLEAWKSEALDGAAYGEPLVYNGDVFVATENDTVYGFSVSNGGPVWAPDHLATPAPAGDLPCGDISPTVGITSTMVIDPSSGVLFASGAAVSGGSVRHYLYAIQSGSGKVLWSRDIDQSWDAAAELQRISLGISDGYALVGFGGNFGDCGQYNGWLLGVPESGSGPILSYKVPTAREGAIWAPGGVTVDASGEVYVATGNGSAQPGQPFDHGNAVIKLSPQLHELGYFAPSSWAQDNEVDGDLGSTAPVLLGNGELFIVGKQQTAYLLSSSSLGGIGGQLASLPLCSSKGASAYQAPYVYVVCDSAGRITQVQVGPGDALHQGWSWSSPSGAASSPTIAGGVLWTIDLRASILYGLDMRNGSTRFSVRLGVGALEHFAATSAAEGMLFVAGTGGVEALH